MVFVFILFVLGGSCVGIWVVLCAVGYKGGEMCVEDEGLGWALWRIAAMMLCCVVLCCWLLWVNRWDGMG